MIGKYAAQVAGTRIRALRTHIDKTPVDPHSTRPAQYSNECWPGDVGINNAHCPWRNVVVEARDTNDNW